MAQRGVRPLDGIRVLDLSRLFPGPYCSMILADFGAEVLRIEDRRFAAEGAGMATVMRNKRHMTLNLRSDTGREIFFRLADAADVVLDGFRPGVLDRLGAGYEEVRRRNPRIVYCAVTGYGQTGPYRDMVGHDVNYISYGGLLGNTGISPDAPPAIPGVQVADVAAGGMNAAIGVLLALFARERSGEGQYVDISMMDGIVGMLPIAATMTWLSGQPPVRGRALLTGQHPFYRVYRCRDGRYVSIGALEPRFWKVLCEHFGKPEWTAHQYDAAKSAEMHAFFEARFAERSRDEWERELREKDVCFGRVLDVAETLDDPHVRARGLVTQIEKNGKPIHVLGVPIKLSATPGAVERPPAEFGEHTDEVLRELGFDADAIVKLRSEGVV